MCSYSGNTLITVKINGSHPISERVSNLDNTYQVVNGDKCYRILYIVKKYYSAVKVCKLGDMYIKPNHPIIVDDEVCTIESYIATINKTSDVIEYTGYLYNIVLDENTQSEISKSNSFDSLLDTQTICTTQPSITVNQTIDQPVGYRVLDYNLDNIPHVCVYTYKISCLNFAYKHRYYGTEKMMEDFANLPDGFSTGIIDLSYYYYDEINNTIQPIKCNLVGHLTGDITVNSINKDLIPRNIPVKYLNNGEYIYNGHEYVKVKNIIKRAISTIELCIVNNIPLTEYQPVWVKINDKCQWKYAKDVCSSRREYTGSLYSIIFDKPTEYIINDYLILQSISSIAKYPETSHKFVDKYFNSAAFNKILSEYSNKDGIIKMYDFIPLIKTMKVKTDDSYEIIDYMVDLAILKKFQY